MQVIADFLGIDVEDVRKKIMKDHLEEMEYIRSLPSIQRSVYREIGIDQRVRDWKYELGLRSSR